MLNMRNVWMLEESNVVLVSLAYIYILLCLKRGLWHADIMVMCLGGAYVALFVKIQV